MKKIAVILSFFAALAVNGLAQNKLTETKNVAELNAVLTSFMKSIRNKDMETFYSLFHEEPVVWIGVYKVNSHRNRLQKDNNIKDYKSGSYQNFFQNIRDNKIEERYYNLEIAEDGYIASLTFDYSFWRDGKKGNWGKESWGLIKTNGQWKITSVIYSIELERVTKEPKRAN